MTFVLVERSERRSLEAKVEDKTRIDALMAKFMKWEIEDAEFIASLPDDYAATLSTYLPVSESRSLSDDVESASAVLVTKSEARDGRLYHVVSKVIRIDPAAEFHYEVGHTVGGSEPLKDFRNKPEGMLSFCSGSPATIRRSYYVYNGRLASYADLPLSAAIHQIEQAVGGQPTTPPRVGD